MKPIKLFCFLSALILAMNLFSQPVLKFKQGKFRIIQFTDLHWIKGNANNDSTIYLMEKLIRSEQPDLVILTGDIVVSDGALEGWRDVTRPMVNTHTPFAVTFGNHDVETDMNKSQIMEFLKNRPYNLTHDAGENVDGNGNCILSIASSQDEKKDNWFLYFFDSHSYPERKTLGSYDWIKNSQIQWYREQSEASREKNNRIVPSLAFFHIPTPEYEMARHLDYTLGNNSEQVCAPELNSGLIAAFIENQDVVGTFVGHDHNNDYIVAPGGEICFAYGRKTGFVSAYDEILERGARVIDLHENERRFDTYIVTLNGESLQYSFEQKLSAENYPIPQGTFIQDFLVTDWSDDQWKKELKALKDAGMQYLVFGPALHTGKDEQSRSIYPSKLIKNQKAKEKDLVERCLSNAQKAGFKVFLGLNFHERWWSGDGDEEWLLEQMEIGNQVADELIEKYKERYGDTMHGWYWVWEVANIEQLSQKKYKDALVNALNINREHLHAVTPDMPFMLCPFMNYRIGNAREYAESWEYVFARTNFQPGDIFAPQDCVGAGGLELGMIPEWFNVLNRAVQTKPGLLFWSDAETFDQRFWTSAPLSRFVEQLNLTTPYVSKIITFAYSHYYSPNVLNDKFHAAYLHYIKNGHLPEASPPPPVSGVVVKKKSNGNHLRWSAPDDISNVVGFYIYRDETLIGNIQFDKNNRFKNEFVDEGTPINQSYSYEITTYNSIGTESVKSKAQLK